MLANGHTGALCYPIGRIWDEAEIVVDRLNGQLATDAISIQMAVSSVLSKKGGDEFKKYIKKLTTGEG